MTDADLQALTRGMAPAVKELVAHAIATVEQRFEARLLALEQRQAVPGRDGRDGIGIVGERGPQGERGEKGERGDVGLRGDDGIGTIGPVGPQGISGEPGERGEKGERGDAGEHGQKGLDGAPGRDGTDGLGFDDMDVTYDGERGFVLTFVRGDRVKTFSFAAPAVIYRGVFEAERTYTAGDQVTYAGSQWIAKHETVGVKPDEHTSDGGRTWTLSTKRGRDGKPGTSGKDGDRGPKGDKGDPGAGKW